MARTVDSSSPATSLPVTNTSRRHRHRAPRWTWALRDSAQAAVWPFLVSRAIVVGTLVLARSVVTEVRPRSHAAVAAAHAGLLGWDAAWYRRIATLGYTGAGRSSIRFFPLYPLLTRGLAALPGVSTGAALLLIANVATFVSLALVHRLAVLESGDDQLGRRAAWWLAMFPTAFVLSMGYADSLLLATSLAMFLALRTRHFAWAALAGLLAGACRPVGLLLALPALVECARGVRRAPVSEWFWRAAAIVAAPAGAACFLAWSKVHEGSFFRPLSDQVSTSNRGGVANPLATLDRDTRYLLHGQHLGTALHAPWAVVLVILAIVLLRRWPIAYGTYAVLTLGVTLTAPNLTSFERYALGCFPFALALASLTKRREAFWSGLAVSGALLAGYGLLAFLGAYIP